MGKGGRGVPRPHTRFTITGDASQCQAQSEPRVFTHFYCHSSDNLTNKQTDAATG